MHPVYCAIRPIMLYDIECWFIKTQHVYKMRMLKWINENVRKNKMWNEYIPLKIRVAFIEETMKRVSWNSLFMCKGDPLSTHKENRFDSSIKNEKS